MTYFENEGGFMQNSIFRNCGMAIMIVGCALLMASSVRAQAGMPAGLLDRDPTVRLHTVQQVGKQQIKTAEKKLAHMVLTDPHSGVREAACLALADVRAASRIELLRSVAMNDPNAGVRDAAAKAVRILRGEPNMPDPQSGGFAAGPSIAPERNRYRQPEIMNLDEKKEIVTRVLAMGIGSMGGYGIASLSIRGRIPIKSPALPSVGIEVGSGWTPPTGYQITAGPVGDVDIEDDRWRIVSVGGAVLLYFHRWHYAALRGGWDKGRGGYAVAAYGFEHLNDEGFFSWGAEVGLLYQPVITDKIVGIVSSPGDTWPIVPCVRFSLHFYMV